jgi:hypothetical protein
MKLWRLRKLKKRGREGKESLPGFQRALLCTVDGKEGMGRKEEKGRT